MGLWTCEDLTNTLELMVFFFFLFSKKTALFDLNSWIILILSAWVWIQDYLSLWSCEDPTNATEVGRPFSRIKYKIHVVLFIYFFQLWPTQLIGRPMKTVSELIPLNYLKRLRLGKTTGWQHRFFDLTILSPIWLGIYEYMKSTLENFFFGLKQGFQSGFFRFGQKFSNLTKFLCTPKNHYFEHFGGQQRSAGL